jgi:hypothetical protein
MDSTNDFGGDKALVGHPIGVQSPGCRRTVRLSESPLFRAADQSESDPVFAGSILFSIFSAASSRLKVGFPKIASDSLAAFEFVVET